MEAIAGPGDFSTGGDVVEKNITFDPQKALFLLFFSMETVAVEKNDSITPKMTYFHQLFSMGHVAIEKSTAGDEVSMEKTAGNDNK